MKKLFLLLLLSGPFFGILAQHNSDSIAYLQQRKKINAMLAQRSAKFGKYDESLKKHTGIFGVQTKKDIRRSNDILMDIVKTDNEIYSELKILLEYRTFQQKRVQTRSTETEASTLGYMTTINTMRSQMAALRRDNQTQEQEQIKTRNTLVLTIIGLSLVMLIIVFIRIRKRPAPKSKRATNKRKS